MGSNRGWPALADRSGKVLCSMAFLLCVLSPRLSFSQKPVVLPDHLARSSPLLDGTDAIHGRISIDVAVTDYKGNAVSGLRAGDFNLLDSGRPQSMVTFDSSESNAEKVESPLSIVLVIDTVDLASPAAAEAERVAEDFLRMNGGVLRHPVIVYRITKSEIQALTNPSMNGDLIARQLKDRKAMRTIWENLPPSAIPKYVPIPDQGTTPPMTRAPAISLPEALKGLGAIIIEQRRVPGRKLLFWIGPGWPSNAASEPRPIQAAFQMVAEFSTRLREARIELFIATQWKSGTNPGEPNALMGPRDESFAFKAIKSPADVSRGSLGPEAIAILSGGEVLYARDRLADVIAGRAKQAESFYQITFDPVPAAGIDEYHALAVTLNRPGLTVRTVSGYYDEPVFYDQPHFGFSPISIAGLEQEIGMRQHSSDHALANYLSSLQLTERMITPRLKNLLAHMPGSKSRSALVALADRSVFLDPPVADVPDMPEPDADVKKQILVRAAEFLKREVPRLPNFYAVRSTVQYGEPEPANDSDWKIASGNHRLELERTTKARVLYRDGDEVADSQQLKGKSSSEQLVTTGTFGPILVSTFHSAMAAGGVIRWSHWEKTANGTAAVFSYSVSPDLDRFHVGFCCLAVDGANEEFKRRTAFHGEMAIDPDTGRFLRLVVEADLEPRLPLLASGIAVEYGPVVLGSETYFCPTRSVSLSRQRRLWEIAEWGMIFRVFGPFKTVLNDESFSNYHLFRSESRILPDYYPVPDKQ